MKWLRDNMMTYYPLGVKKNTTEEVK